MAWLVITAGFLIAAFAAVTGGSGTAMISVISVAVFGVGLMITGAVFEAKNEIVAAIKAASTDVPSAK